MGQRADQNQTDWPYGPGDNSLQEQAMTSVSWKVASPEKTSLVWDRAWKTTLARLVASDADQP